MAVQVQSPVDRVHEFRLHCVVFQTYQPRFRCLTTAFFFSPSTQSHRFLLPAFAASRLLPSSSTPNDYIFTMPPKKDAAAGESDALLVGFTNKETKLLAAAFVSSTAPDKFDYDIMSTLTANTAGSLKKMCT